MGKGPVYSASFASSGLAARRVLFPFAGLALLSSCGAVQNWREAYSTAQTATIQLYRRIGEGDPLAVEMHFGEKLRRRYSPEQVSELVERVRADSGECDTPRILGHRYSVTPTGRFVILQARAKCRERELATELIWRIRGEAAQLDDFTFGARIASSR
jgi:hypothetical protein